MVGVGKDPKDDLQGTPSTGPGFSKAHPPWMGSLWLRHSPALEGGIA